MVAPLLAGWSGVSPTKGLETACVRNVSAAAIAKRALRPELLRHVVHGFEDRQVASPLTEIRNLDEEVSGELTFDPEAVSPVLRIDAIRERDVPGRVAEIGRQTLARSDRHEQLAARNGIGQIRLERQPVVARHRHGRIARVPDLIQTRGDARHALNLKRRDEESDSTAQNGAFRKLVGEARAWLEVVLVRVPRRRLIARKIGIASTNVERRRRDRHARGRIRGEIGARLRFDRIRASSDRSRRCCGSPPR